MSFGAGCDPEIVDVLLVKTNARNFKFGLDIPEGLCNFVVVRHHGYGSQAGLKDVYAIRWPLALLDLFEITRVCLPHGDE